MGTDGLFDNLFDEDVKKCVNKSIKDYSNNDDLTQRGVFEAASCLSTYAEFMSYQKKYESPFTRGALESGKSLEKNLGGKEDDITVIVG